MKNSVFIILCALCINLGAQPLPNRYLEEVFVNITETNDILFSEGVPQPTPGGGFYEFITGLPLNADETDTEPVDLYMDIFEPDGDTLAARPAIVICFGGGFLSGTRDYWSIRLLCQELARRGFVTVSIDYRLGMNIFDSDLAMRAVYRGIQDGRAAVKFLRTNASTYNIDPNEIYIGGHSAGAFIALHNLYLDQEIERPLSTFEWIQNGESIPDLGCLDCTGINGGKATGLANCAFSLAGAVGFVEYLESADDGQTVLFHSEDDGTVPYDSGEPFSNISFLVIGSDLPDVYGSLPISIRSDTIGLPYDFHSYTDRGHGVHEDGSSMLYSDIVPGISDWFYNQRLAPQQHPLEGRQTVCSDQLSQSYSIAAGDATYFDWQITGGSFVMQSTTSNSATVMWSDTAAVHSISVTPYNQWGARGETQELNITLGAHLVNTWTSGSGSWSEPSNWSLGHVPQRCEDVMIVQSSPQITIDIPDGMLVEVRSLFIIGDVLLQTGTAAEIVMQQAW